MIKSNLNLPIDDFQLLGLYAMIALAGAEDLEYAVSADEIFALRIWMANSISTLTKKLALRQRVTATAIIFFHRFYACSPGNSFCSTDPALVATACVYVAAKVEEAPLHIRNVAQEAAKHWSELGHPNMSSEISVLAEMEFYLLEDLQFHLVVYHPYRSLVIIAGAAGMGALQRASSKPSMATTWSKMLSALPGAHANQTTNINRPEAPTTPTLSSNLTASDNLSVTVDSEMAFGTPADGLAGRSEDNTFNPDKRAASKEHVEQRKAFMEAIEARQRLLLFEGDDEMPLAQLDELDEQVLQMAWFVLNDSYRTNLLLLFPPHLVAVAAIFLALVLHDSSREKMLKSKRWMEDRRTKHRLDAQTSDSKSDAEMKTADARGVGSPSGASPPKQNTSVPSPTPSTAAISNGNGNSSQGASTPRPPLRGLASLPPRPSHLPPRPGSSTIASAMNPASAPKGSVDPIQKGSPDMTSPKGTIDDGKTSKSKELSVTMPVPPPDAMTFLAALNVDLNAVGEIIQEMSSLYQFWSREGDEDGAGGILDLNDSLDMFKRLERMRESRRLDLLQNGPGW